MSSSYAKYSEKYWLKSLNFTDNYVAKSELVEIIIRISTAGVGLERMNQGHFPDKRALNKHSAIMDNILLVLGYLWDILYSTPAWFGGRVYNSIHIIILHLYSRNNYVVTGFQ